MSTETDEMSDLIEEAENKSAKICEICGEVGTLRKINGWYETICEKCQNKRENNENNL